MKYSFALASATLVGLSSAFPAAVMEAVAADPELYKEELNKRVMGIAPGFDASKQYTSTTGEHKWVAPGPTDQRGPCPGLNALANHGYIPHSGIATIDEFIAGTTEAVGMGLDLAGFLAVYGAVFDGDLTKWSIGGPDSRVGVPLLGQPLGVLGKPQGISGSHNKYEADASPTRGDLYQHGNDYLVVLEQFTEFYGMLAGVPEEERNYDLGVQTAFRVKRFSQSVNENPYFFNNFFSGLLVAPAGFTFPFRFMGNHSSQYPEGYLSGDVLKSWFGIEGEYPNFKHTPGYERIPDYWYRRAYGDEYTIPFFLSDVATQGLQSPQFFDIGGNTNGVNTFTGLDIVNLTQGAYNAKDFTDPNVLACFIYEMLTSQSPDILLPNFQMAFGALSILQEAAGKLVVDLNCKSLDNIQKGQFHEAMLPYPGYSKLNFETGQYD